MKKIMHRDSSVVTVSEMSELKTRSFSVNNVQNAPRINDVFYRQLTTHIDGRGDLTEIYSKPWSESLPLQPIEHAYHNTTGLYVTKGWHYHLHTFSQYVGVSGKFQVVLVDIRPDSNTYLNVDTFIVGTKCPSLIIIPPGIMKGWKALEENSIIINLLSSSDTKDNFKIKLDEILPSIWEPHNG